MAIFRQYIAPLLVVLIFLFALVAVSARIFLPGDMAAPAPIEEDGGIGRWSDGENMNIAFNVPLYSCPHLNL
ncbi:MAG: hypothetical protein N2235_25845 [Fischerella sp.]|nr:hypothetical protein [Fischerella sp.]